MALPRQEARVVERFRIVEAAEQESVTEAGRRLSDCDRDHAGSGWPGNNCHRGPGITSPRGNVQARATRLTRAVPQLRHSSISGCYFFAAFFFVPQVFFVLQPAMPRPPRCDF